MKDAIKTTRRLLLGFVAGTALVGTVVTGLPIPATAQTEKVEQTTEATRGDNGGVPGYWITVKERIFSWEEQKYIDVVAFYRPYRQTWLDWLGTNNWNAGWGMTPYGYIPSWHAGGRYDNWWQGVNEDQVKDAVAKVGYNTIRDYVRDKTSAAWQNQGLLFLDPYTGKILGSMSVNNSYDASNKVLSLLNKETSISLDTGSFMVNLKATSVLSSPIVLDLAGLGKPDLLAGPIWNVIPGRKIASTALRSFDLDGTGDYSWEWVGPKSGLLVWNAGGQGQIESGEQLFGHHTWGKTWKDGYEALATLDDDGNGQITRKEFADLGIWVDANSNGISEKGEVKSLDAWGIESVSLKAQRDKTGNAWVPQGFTRKMPDGKRKTLSTWDWMAMGEPKPADGTYVWVGQAGDLKLGGYFNLHREGDEVRGITVPTVGVPQYSKPLLIGFPITGTRKGESIRWSVPTADGTCVSEVSWDGGGKHLYGKTKVDTKDVKTEYLWQADLVAGNPVAGSRSARKVN